MNRNKKITVSDVLTMYLMEKVILGRVIKVTSLILEILQPKLTLKK